MQAVSLLQDSLSIFFLVNPALLIKVRDDPAFPVYPVK